MKYLLLIFFTVTSLSSFACPIGAKEDHLTLQRVMRNFGKFSREAESVALAGIDNPANVKEVSLDKSITDLNTVILCVDAVIKNPSGDLLPDDTRVMSADELNHFIELFIKYMNDFKSATIEFQRLLIAEKSKPISERNFKPIYKFDMEVFNPIVDRAHKEL